MFVFRVRRRRRPWRERGGRIGISTGTAGTSGGGGADGNAGTTGKAGTTGADLTLSLVRLRCEFDR